MNKQKQRSKITLHVTPSLVPKAKKPVMTKRKVVKTKAKRSIHLATATNHTTKSTPFQTTSTPISPTISSSRGTHGSVHPALKHIPTMVMFQSHHHNPITITSRHLSTTPTRQNTTTTTAKKPLPKHLQGSNKQFLPNYGLKLQALLHPTSSVQTISKRHFNSTAKKILSGMISGLTDLFNGVKNMANPFRNKRGNTISLDGSVPWQYKVRNVLMVGLVGAVALGGVYLILKSLMLAMKITFVFLIFNFFRKKLIEHAILNNDLDRAIMFETWGESHSNDNPVAKLLWLANPISWWRRVQHFLSLERRKHERCSEIAQEVTKQLQLDSRMVPLFGQGYIIGEMNRDVGEMGLEDEQLFDGFITIPIYSSAPTVIDLDTGNNTHSSHSQKSRYRITGTDAPNKVAMEEFSQEMDRELDRRMTAKYGKNHLDSHFREGLEMLDKMRQEYLDGIDLHEDVNYKYKHYKPVPKWKWNTLDGDEREAIVQGKKETFFSNRNIQDRINILDFEALALRWSDVKWDLRQNRIHSRDGIMMPTADKELTEVGTIYAFFSVPALENIVSEKNNRIAFDAMNILTQGTSQPFQLEKVFAVGENVERFTLFHKDISKWSINPSLSTDRTITNYRRNKRDFITKPQETVKSATKVVDFDMETMKPVVEAEMVQPDAIEAETVDYSNSGKGDSKGKMVEAEILK